MLQSPGLQRFSALGIVQDIFIAFQPSSNGNGIMQEYFAGTVCACVAQNRGFLLPDDRIAQ